MRWDRKELYTWVRTVVVLTMDMEKGPSSQGIDSKTSFSSGQTRRGFLTASSVGLAAAIAGCSGKGDKTTTKSSNSGKYSDVSLNYWGIANVQSDAAQKRVQEIVNRFEKDTGASIKVNNSGYEQLKGAKWIKSFGRGNQPAVFDTEPTYMGRFYENDYIVPYSEYKADLPSEINDHMSWIFDTYSKGMQGWDEDAFDIPWGFLPRNGFQVRADHMRQAGLDPEKDFPPKDFDHLVEVAKKLQNNGPGRWGFQLFGDIYDWMDSLQPWMAARAGVKGEFLNQDWTKTNFDNDVYIETVKDAVHLYKDLGLSSPETPTISDEKTTNLMLQGEVSMSSVEWLNIPSISERRPELYKSGDFKWGTNFPNGGVMGYFSVGLSKKPDGVDKQKWDRKQKAATDFMATWLGKWNQKTAINTLGAFPANKSVWEKESLPGEKKNNTLKSAFTMAKNAEAVWETHPAIAEIKDTMAGKAIQDVYKGADPEQRMKKLASDANKKL